MPAAKKSEERPYPSLPDLPTTTGITASMSDYPAFLAQVVAAQRLTVDSNPKGKAQPTLAGAKAREAILAERELSEDVIGELEAIEASFAELLMNHPESAVHLAQLFANFSQPIENEATYQAYEFSRTSKTAEEEVPAVVVALEWMEKASTGVFNLASLDESVMTQLISLSTPIFAKDDDGNEKKDKAGNPVLSHWEGPLRPKTPAEETDPAKVTEWKLNLRNVGSHLQRTESKSGGRGLAIEYYDWSVGPIGGDAVEVEKETPIVKLLARYLPDVAPREFTDAWEAAKKESKSDNFTFTVGGYTVGAVKRTKK